MRFQSMCRVQGVREIHDTIRVFTFLCSDIAREIRSGQFLSIRVSATGDPLLRRPFSVYRTDGDAVEVIFHVVGKGTSILAARRPGEMLDVLGPLGVPFGIENGDFSTALLVGGGLGVAPFPLATAALRRSGREVVTFLGARSGDQIIDSYLDHVQVATDDGSRGLKGTVVQLLDRWLDEHPVPGPKIFGCGPNPMLRALASVAHRRGIPCEVSLEGPMACGFGICQGCPVELTGGDRKYALMCTDGPVFDTRRITIPA
jgi:dihydroorotate dehydrogenase electron transfer subunit